MSSLSAPVSFGFQEILRVRLSLTVELFADALHRNNRFTRWASGREDDNIFGSIGNAFNVCWKGMMALAYPPQVGLDLDLFADKLRTDLNSSQPTRIVLVLEVNSWMSYALDDRQYCPTERRAWGCYRCWTQCCEA